MFFERPFAPEALDQFAGAVSDWLCSDDLRWLVERVPGRRDPDGPVEALAWPRELAGPHLASPVGRGRLAKTVDALEEVCNWACPGTVWDYRVRGERLLSPHDSSSLRDVSPTAVADRAAALGLCSDGCLQTRPRTLVVLGGRRMAPLNRTRAAALAIQTASLGATRIVLLSAHRVLDRRERESPEVRAYAAGARTEADLMAAAARCVLDIDPRDAKDRAAASADEIRLVETPAPRGARRASTYETLQLVADELEIDAASPVGLVTSPTCRPFQYLEAVRALGLQRGLSFELVAHPRAWAAAPGSPVAAPQVYLQEIRSVVQAAGRLSEALIGDAVASPYARPSMLA